MQTRSPLFLRVFARLGLGLMLLVGLYVALGRRAQPAHAQSTITVSTCDESHLDAAISRANSDNAGDTITFSCSGDITLTSTLMISGHMTLDGSGQQVTLDGQNRVRVLSVNSNVTFTLNALTIAHGLTSTTVLGGGGLLNQGGGTVNISNSTFANNSATAGGGLFNIFETVNISGSIVANDTGGNCSGGVSDQGNNLQSDGSCGFTRVDDLNTDPKLDPSGLQDNGGPTQTIALQQGSPAIDWVASSCPSSDQRGAPRPDDASESKCPGQHHDQRHQSTGGRGHLHATNRNGRKWGQPARLGELRASFRLNPPHRHHHRHLHGNRQR